MSNRAEPTVVDADLLRDWPMPVHDGGDKFVRGTTVVIGGSPRTPGAVKLAGEAALRMGAGRLEIVTADAVAGPLGVAVPEALVVGLPCDPADGLRWDAADHRLEEMVAGADAVLIGPGLLGDDVDELVTQILRTCRDEALVVLDARALGTLPGLDPDVVPSGRLLLTPNRQELHHLAGDDRDAPYDGDDPDDCRRAGRVAERFAAVVTCFGHVTAADHCWEVAAGTPGLGTSGSGDVLAGLALGAAVRCGDVAHAGCWATFVHAHAGERLARRGGELSFLARDLVAEVPAVLAALER